MINVPDSDNLVWSEKTKSFFVRNRRILARPRWSLPNKSREKDLVAKGAQAKIRSCIAGDDPWPLVFLGKVQGGKTCAALCFCDWAGDAIHVEIDDLCDHIIDCQRGRGFVRRGETVDQLFERDLWKDWKTCNLAVLDELGLRTNISDHHYRVTKKAIQSRIDDDLPLVVISNLPLDGIGAIYDKRISERLSQGTVVEFTDGCRVPVKP